jgi:hypothetical protein
MGMRVKDTGESECRFVMTRIGAEEQSNIALPERVQTSGWSLLAKEFVEPLKRRTGK